MLSKDFTPTAQQISLHGLGFIQVKLCGAQRLHVWHPDLPRRACWQHSAIHNHRFSFASRVLIGEQVNQRYNVVEGVNGSHDIISHDGPRSEKGGRLSFVSGQACIDAMPVETILSGETYYMPEGQYHETPNTGIVVTVLNKLSEGTIHACSLIERGYAFDQDFDRFQLPSERLWQFVLDAFEQGGSE